MRSHSEYKLCTTCTEKRPLLASACGRARCPVWLLRSHYAEAGGYAAPLLCARAESVALLAGNRARARQQSYRRQALRSRTGWPQHAQNASGVVTRWRGSPTCALARSLFHRVHADEPLRATTNRSLPAAHLSPPLVARVAHLASQPLSDASTHAALRAGRCSETGLAVPALARETGVSIARFERLVELVRAADAEEEGPAGALAGRGTALLLRLLWLRASARGKPALWEYLRELDAVTDGRAMTDEAKARTGWSAALAAGGAPPPPDWSEGFTAADLAAEQARAAVHLLISSDGGGGGGGSGGSGGGNGIGASADCGVAGDGVACEVARGFEVAAAALALGGARSPPLQEQRAAWGDFPAVADCAELALRELTNALLWCPSLQGFDASRLPPSASRKLIDFYASGRAGAAGAAVEWMRLVSNLRGVTYLAGVPGRRYELKPTGPDLLAVLSSLLGVRLPDVGALQALWARCEAGRALEIRSRVHAGQERITLSEGGVPSLELVLCPASNHAFAIHHWAAPPWQRDAAAAALNAWRREPGAALGREALISSLRPSLLQPMLPLSATEQRAAAAAATAAPDHACRGVGSSDDAVVDDGDFGDAGASERRRQRLMLLCADPSRPGDLAASVCRVLGDGGGDSEGDSGGGVGCGQGARFDEGQGDADVALAAAVLRQPLSAPLSSLPPPQLLRLAAAVAPAAQRSDELSAAVQTHPELAACMSVRRAVAALGGSGAAASWTAVVYAAPARVLAAWYRCRTALLGSVSVV